MASEAVRQRQRGDDRCGVRTGNGSDYTRIRLCTVQLPVQCFNSRPPICGRVRRKRLAAFGFALQAVIPRWWNSHSLLRSVSLAFHGHVALAPP
jgi:hypothetical protein